MSISGISADKIFRILLILLNSWAFLPAQEQQSVFPGLTGQTLLDSLVARYKPATVLGYDNARDKMYGLIDNEGDSVRGVYTGYTVYVPYNHPTPRDFTNAASPIINAEHSWPTSKGASGNARSDMHHLFPTNGDANAARGSNPFDEIPDQQTDRWWYGSSYITQLPGSDIGLYSEDDLGIRFEPREDHKGNCARAMFYFYTMYREQADAADADFFEIQKTVLFSWHRTDAVDAREAERSRDIAGYQDDKENPFVLDSTLVQRCYFPALSLRSEAGPVSPGQKPLIRNYPNPFNPSTTIQIVIDRPAEAELEIFDAAGRRINRLYYGHIPAGTHTYNWTGTNRSGRPVASGIYILRLLIHRPGNLSEFYIRKMLLLR